MSAMTEPKNRIGSQIKSIRKKRGITQEELAESAGISLSYLNRLENGKNANFGWKVIEKILCLLDASISIDSKKGGMSKGLNRREGKMPIAFRVGTMTVYHSGREDCRYLDETGTCEYHIEHLERGGSLDLIDENEWIPIYTKKDLKTDWETLKARHQKKSA